MRRFLSLLLPLMLACGTSHPGTPPPTGTTVLSGMYAFPVHYALLVPTPMAQCGFAGTLPDGAYAAFALYLTGAPITDVCPDAANAHGQSGQPFVAIQVASPSYATNIRLPDGGSPVPLAAGTYKIGYEGVTDDDLCMLYPTGGTALVDALDFVDGGVGATGVATAYSGTVTLTVAGNGRVAGSFNVMMAPVMTSIDTQHLVPFSGTFDATTCPGTSQ